MHASTRSRALRAALTVTLGSPILACGGNVAAEDGDAAVRDDVVTVANGHDDAHARSTHTADARAVVVDAVAEGPCPGLVSSVNATVASSTFACCTTYLESALGDGGTPLQGPAATACCTSVIAFVDHGGYPALIEAGLPAEEAVGSCCGLLSPDGGGPPEGAACTPWGPPVPPRMRLSRRALRALLLEVA